ncbi:MFS transporter [Streptomyces liangshanensis]|uniref:MFS transporter n=1 Tax=Streptomyces liangshanensis TaxID=2717324 RepID=A0A6G9GSJ4_9ACTN|nr:MFS transporter [Streptomyces liangshanensis]QIQ00981.1 MFS transporter [Streptomyces liangshanensis]
MRTYGQLFRTPEFTPFFLTSSVQVASATVAGLALATLVYRSTGSALLSALSMFGPSLAQVVGATLLLSAADRLPPRAATAAVALAVGAGTAVLAVPGLPLWAVFAILLAEGLATSVGGGVRYGLLAEILPKDGYLLGRSVLNMSVGTMQIAGYATGGVLLAVLSPRGALLTAAALGVAAAVLAAAGLSSRPPRTAGRPSVAETWRTNRRLWSSPARRTVYLALWVPNGLVVGCESLFVPYDPGHAGLLFACAALGMLIGDTLAGRFLPRHRRERLGAPLRLLLALPYLVFAWQPSAPLAAAAATVASIGFASSLLLQESLIALTPDDIQGQALGLDTSGRLTLQGVAAALAGALAQYTSAATAITLMAAASLAVTLTLAPGLRPERITAALVPAVEPAPGGGR